MKNVFHIQGAAVCNRRLISSAVANRRSLLAAFVWLFAGCEMMDYKPPVVSGRMASAKHVDPVRLQKGRTLFAHRCIECHTLPVVWYYNKSDWPRLVDSMSARASLKPAERDAIVAYILAARDQR